MVKSTTHSTPPLSLLITANNLALIRGNRRLFKGLSFSLSTGQAIHLCGKNGSGKTSLFKVLTGMLAPTVGELALFGKPLKDIEHGDYQNLLYLGHQSAIKYNLTVAENLAFNAELFDGLSVDKTQLQHALSAVGLWAFRSQLAGKLSAGQQRRIMLARLWLVLFQGKSKKALWLLDEPLTALDAAFIEILQAHITEYLTLGGGVIFTSHQTLKLGCEVQMLDLGDFA